MSVFVDTGVFYAHHDTDASRHTVGADALNTVLSSAEYGHVMTSDYSIRLRRFSIVPCPFTRRTPTTSSVSPTR